MYWAQMFHAKGKAYIIGTSSDLTGPGRLMISRCTSIPCTGRGWTRPTQLFADSGLKFHAAPTPVAAAADGQLFRAVDIIVDGDIQVVMLVGTAECVDYTAPECWQRSQGVSYDPKWWPGSSQSSLPPLLLRDGVGAPRMWEEPGAIVDAATGAVTAMVRLDHPLETCSSLEECNRAALLSYDVANNRLSFDKIVQFPSVSLSCLFERTSSPGSSPCTSPGVLSVCRAAISLRSGRIRGQKRGIFMRLLIPLPRGSARVGSGTRSSLPDHQT